MTVRAAIVAANASDSSQSRVWWLIHNCLVHPICGVLWFLGLNLLAKKLHPPHVFDFSGLTSEELAHIKDLYEAQSKQNL